MLSKPHDDYFSGAEIAAREKHPRRNLAYTAAVYHGGAVLALVTEDEPGYYALKLCHGDSLDEMMDFADLLNRERLNLPPFASTQIITSSMIRLQKPRGQIVYRHVDKPKEEKAPGK
jgi:hypothetical protein